MSVFFSIFLPQTLHRVYITCRLALDFYLLDFHRLQLIHCSHCRLGQQRAVMMRNLPLAVLVDVNERVTPLGNRAVSERELIQAGILGPVGTDFDIAFGDRAHRFLLTEMDEVVLDFVVGVSRLVGEGW